MKRLIDDLLRVCEAVTDGSLKGQRQSPTLLRRYRQLKGAAK